MKPILLIAVAALVSTVATAQNGRQWTLDECIDYAQQNNITVQQQQIVIDNALTSLNTAQWARVPSLSGSVSSSLSLGRGQSRDGTYQDNTQVSGSAGLSTSVSLFDGFQLSNQIRSARMDLQIAMLQFAASRESVELNVISLFLNALYCKELVVVAEKQSALSSGQAERSKMLFESGRTAESTVFESEALAASDEVTLTQRRNDLMLALVDLSQALNLDSSEGFDIALPDTNSFSAVELSELPTIEQTFDRSLHSRPSVLVENDRLTRSQIQLRISKAQLLPSLNASAGYNTSAYHSFANSAQNSAFWEQMRNNAYGYAGLSLSIPIFNRRQTINNIKAAHLAVRSQQLAVTEAERTLRKQIEQAYYGAVAAFAQYRSAEKAMLSAEKAFECENEKMNSNRSTIFDYNDAKTRMQKAESDCVQAKYEFIFRRRILDFYAR